VKKCIGKYGTIQRLQTVICFGFQELYCGGTCFFSVFRLEESLVETGECPAVLDILPKE
jgi:hypothetical protein